MQQQSNPLHTNPNHAGLSQSAPIQTAPNQTIFISPLEPAPIKELFANSRIDAIGNSSLGFDFLLVTRRGQIPIERKKIPDDLIASVRDGRLARELVAMRSVSRFYIVLLHGRFTFKGDGTMVTPGKGRDWTKKGIKNLLRTLQFVEGAFIEWAETDAELVDTIVQLQDYFDQTHHLSMRIRPGLDSNWVVPTYEERIRFFYQGLPRISALRSRDLAKQFKSPLDLFGASVEDMMAIHGIGKSLASGIYNFLRGIG